MKKYLVVLSLLAMTVLWICGPAYQATAAPIVTINLENPPPGGVLELVVGEKHTFDISIASDEPFVVALAMTDQYYPGRGIFWHGSDRATQATTADLHLTLTGKESTADLPDGVAPSSIVVGVRYKGGVVLSEIFTFVVRVP